MLGQDYVQPVKDSMIMILNGRHEEPVSWTGGEGDGQTILSTVLFIFYSICITEEIWIQNAKKDAMPKIKLQWIVYFTATLKQKLIFYFYYEKGSLRV